MRYVHDRGFEIRRTPEMRQLNRYVKDTSLRKSGCYKSYLACICLVSI